MALSFEEALTELEAAPAILSELVDRLTEAQMHFKARQTFAVVEQLWHLADLEVEGFGRRIDLLLSEEWPFLPDFDGDRVARERNYLLRRPADGLRAFALAREANLTVLRTLSRAERGRSGSQEGVGTVALGELPMKMVEHDQSHFAELIELLDGIGLGPMVPPAMRRDPPQRSAA